MGEKREFWVGRGEREIEKKAMMLDLQRSSISWKIKFNETDGCKQKDLEDLNACEQGRYNIFHNCK